MSESQWYIAQGEDVQGPFTHEKVLDYIRRGRVRQEMMFSRDGGDWVAGSDLPELFPAERGTPPPLPEPPEPSVAPAPKPAARRAAAPSSRAARAPAPSRRAAATPTRGRARARTEAETPARGTQPRRTRAADRARRGTPTGFLTASILDFIFAGFAIAGGGYVAWASGRLLDAMESRGELQLRELLEPELIARLESLATMGWVFVVTGLVAGAMGLYVRTGTTEARTTQFVVSILCLGVCGWALFDGWIGAVTLVCTGAQAAALFVMFQLKPQKRLRRDIAREF